MSKRQIIALGSEHDLTSMQAMTVFLLNRPRPMREFTSIFHCDPSNVTGIVDGLEQKKLVERAENPNDRRVKMVQLTDTGKTVRASLVTELTGRNSSMFKYLTSAEIAQFIQLVQKISQ